MGDHGQTAARTISRFDSVPAFLRERRDQILRTWEQLVVAEVRRVELAGLALRDSIPAFLDELADWLARGASPGDAALDAHSLDHVLDRLDQGFDLGQFLREYRLLREAILHCVLDAERLEQHEAGPGGEPARGERVVELARLNAGLDVALSAAVEQFVAERDRRAAAERALAEAEGRRNEERYRRLVEQVTDGIFVADPDGRYTDVNPAGCAMLGRTREEVLASTFLDVLVPEEHVRLPEAIASFADGEVHRSEWRYRRKDGSTFVGELDGRRLPDGRFQGVLRDVTERKRAEAALRASEARHREQDRRKTEFLAVLSHELRNPLAPIRASVHLLDRAPPGSEAFVRARKIIERQADHLARLVDDLLDVVRISRGRVELHRQRVDLRALVQEATDAARPLFAAAGVELRLEHAPGPTFVDADPTRITQLVGNLLHNAQKFTPAGGAVTVRLDTDPEAGTARLRVTDTGVGMEPGHEQEMFEPFAQGDQGLARTKGGLGLGLSLVKLFTEMHGGAVSARSEGSGRGTELVVTLPLAPGAAATG